MPACSLQSAVIYFDLYYGEKDALMYNPQLKTFFTVIESGSFSKAAAELYLTPSAVLHQIRALEKDLGVELFSPYKQRRYPDPGRGISGSTRTQLYPNGR